MSLMVLEVYNHNVFEKFGRKIKRTIVWVERLKPDMTGKLHLSLDVV
jgi:hypothetical protein